MINLMKYELKKRKVFIIGALSLLGAAELLALYNLYARGGELVPFTLMLTFAMFIGVYLYTWLSYVVDYYCDFTGKQRLLLMSVPKTSYQITGAKALYVFLENIVLFLIVSGLTVLNNYLYFLQSGDNVLSIVIEQIGIMIESIPIEISTFNLVTMIIIGILAVVFQYVFSIATAGLAITISTTVISGNKLNWLISILIYWGLSFVLKLFMVIPAFIMDNMETIESIGPVYTLFGFIAGGYLIFIIAEYIVTNVLITKKLDV